MLLHLENFGPIKQGTIDLSKKATLFTGHIHPAMQHIFRFLKEIILPKHLKGVNHLKFTSYDVEYWPHGYFFSLNRRAQEQILTAYSQYLTENVASFLVECPSESYNNAKITLEHEIPYEFLFSVYTDKEENVPQAYLQSLFWTSKSIDFTNQLTAYYQNTAEEHFLVREAQIFCNMPETYAHPTEFLYKVRYLLSMAGNLRNKVFLTTQNENLAGFFNIFYNAAYLQDGRVDVLKLKDNYRTFSENISELPSLKHTDFQAYCLHEGILQPITEKEYGLYFEDLRVSRRLEQELDALLLNALDDFRRSL